MPIPHARFTAGALSLAAAALLAVAAMRGNPSMGAIRRDAAPPPPDPAWVRGLSPSQPGTPLPDDPELAAWTLAAERAFYPALRLAELAQDSPPTGPDPARAGKAWAAWGLVERSGLPTSDALRVKAARHFIEAVAHEQPLEAARLAEHHGMLPMAMALYRKGQSPEDDSRILKMRELRARELASARPERKPPSSPAEHLRRFTFSESAGHEPCTPTAPEFLRLLPDNARLRRAAMLAFNPCSDCGFQDTTGVFDGDEPLLRLTAEAAPDEFVRTFAALRHARVAESRRGRPDLRESGLAGDSGETGNALRVLRDLLPRLPPSARDELARELLSPERSPAVLSARTRALRAYLEAGAPDPGPDWRATVAARLREDDARARLWALGWLRGPAATGPEPTPEKLPGALTSLFARVALRADSLDEQVLVLLAASSFPGPAALPVMVQAGTTDAWEQGVEALAALQRAHQERTTHQPGFDLQPPASPELSALSSAIIAAYRGRICAPSHHATTLRRLLVVLGDPEAERAAETCQPPRSPG